MKNNEFWDKALGNSSIQCRCPVCGCAATYLGNSREVNSAMETFYELHARCQTSSPLGRKQAAKVSTNSSGTRSVNIEELIQDEHGAMFCDHANEVPLQCICSKNCYCKSHTCSKPVPPEPPEFGGSINNLNSNYSWWQKLVQWWNQ